ncbi:MAG: thymidine phosphorylase [Candidatus Pacebacteria bacterium]|nr:thymidine phosphorylase [Candidatus Paceibacterota bacterium]
MNYFPLKTKHIDIDTDDGFKVVVNDNTALKYSLKNKDTIYFYFNNQEVYAEVFTTASLLGDDEIGLCQGLREIYDIPENEILKIYFAEESLGLKAIHKKLLGNRLTYEDCLNIMNDLVVNKINDVETAFFIALGFQKNPFTIQELCYLSKAQAVVGDCLKFNGIVADKHSVGGLSGNRTTPIVVAIVASFNIIIPKTSSRAITSVAGTADTLETIMDVSFSTNEIYKLIEKNNACMIWGGAINLSPTDDIFIKITKDLGIEPTYKLITSILSKKIATGVNRLIIDIPVNKTAKVKSIKEALKVKKMFEKVSKFLKIKTKVIISKSTGIIGNGVGPALEIRDVLRVLQQKENRSIDLEDKAVNLAGSLLNLCGIKNGVKQARESLKTGKALLKFREIIDAQNGDYNIDSEDIQLAKYSYEFKLNKKGIVPEYNNDDIVDLCKMLGAPQNKRSGIYFNKKTNENYTYDDVIFTIYSDNESRINIAKDIIKETFDPLFK